HTRWPRDWSSDVCSSDLSRAGGRVHATLASGEETRRPSECRALRIARVRRGETAERKYRAELTATQTAPGGPLQGAGVPCPRSGVGAARSPTGPLRRYRLRAVAARPA